ncbi:MAG: hypothetical protein Q8M08_08870 [Bacteroidales bacterium]|nr:hypothetical protein [Bacteroidales bacterium]
MDFNKLFNDTTTSLKLDFLQSLLQKNEGLKNQFTEYCKRSNSEITENPEQKNPRDMIRTISLKYISVLNSLDFEDMDWRDYQPRHSGYIEDYEAVEDFAQDQLDDIFHEWQEQIGSMINNGHILNATCGMLGAYDACLTAYIEGSGDIFNDLTETLLQKHQELVYDAISRIGVTVVSGDQAFQAIVAVLDHYQRNYQGMKNYLNYFESLFICLADTEEIGEQVLANLQRSGIEESWLPQLAVKLYAFRPDQTEWVKKAAQFFMNDLNVAKQLLDYYFGHDMAAFLRDGKSLFDLHPESFSLYMCERLTPELYPDFFKKVLWYRASHERNIALYETLRGYLDDGEKQLFLSGIEFDMVFRIKVLEIEHRFEDILKLAQNEVEHTWHFPELITPILNIYPDEAFELINFKATRTVENERGRSAYRRICTWLKLALQIRTREEETRHLIHSLYYRKPALPALKEEMREAGVMG